jgi:hypothetical protein
MNVVLAIEPDSAQAEPLSTLIRTKLGAELTTVTSAYAAVVAINQRVPDVILFGRSVSQDQRAKISAHLKSVTAASHVQALEIPPFVNRKNGAATDVAKFEGLLHVSFVAAGAVKVKGHKATAARATPVLSTPVAVEDVPDDLRSAEIALIEAEVEFRLNCELERVRADAAQAQARELARVEAEAAEHRAREIEKIEREAAAQRESAVAEARGEAEAAAREAVAAELERVKSAAEQQLAAEVARVRAEADQALTLKLQQAQSDAEREREERFERMREEAEAARLEVVRQAEAARLAAIEEAKRTADEAAARAREAEAEIARLRAAADAQLKAALEQARSESDERLREQVARVQSATEAIEADRIRMEAAAAARAAAEEALAAETARIQDEANRRLETAVQEAQRFAKDAAQRARDAEEETARLRAEADAQLKAALEQARRENESRLQAQVARAQAETEARLEAQLASVMGENEQVRQAHQQATREAERIRTEVAEAARAAAEAALAAETERIQAEANKRLEAEISRLRAEAARQRAASAAASSDESDASVVDTIVEGPALFAEVSDETSTRRRSLEHVRWDLVGVAAVVAIAIGASVMGLPHMLSSAQTQSTALVHESTALVHEKSAALVDTADNAAKKAAVVAPILTRKAIAAAERAVPVRDVVNANRPVATASAPASDTKADTGPGFIVAFSRVPMDLYADGKRIGTTEDGQILLPPGAHRIEFVSTRFAYRSSTNVTIRPGQVTPYTIALPTGLVRVTTVPGAEVWVEGQRVGVAPLDAFPVPIGTREVVVKDARGERRQAVEVKFGETYELTLLPDGIVNTSAPGAPQLAPLNSYQPKSQVR